MEFEEGKDYPEEKMQEDIECLKRALESFLQSKFSDANRHLGDEKDDANGNSPYIILGRTMLHFFQAAMSFAKDDFDACLTYLGNSIHSVKRYKYSRNFIEHFSSMLAETSVKHFSIVEKHIELVYSQLVIIRAISRMLIKDTGLVMLIKELIKVRSCYFAYKSCYHWLEANELLDSEKFRDLFSMTAFGMGVFNMMGSLVTPRVRDTCHIVGFDGDRELATTLLKQGYQCNGVMSAGCRLAYKIFFVYISQLFELRVPNDMNLEALADEETERYPIGIYSAFLRGRNLMGQRRILDALSVFSRSICIEYELPAATHYQHWDILMIHLSLGRFDQALETAEYLYANSRWSKSFYAYAAGICYLMFGNEEKAAHYFDIVPQMRQKIAGKKIPFEKMVCRKVEKYALSKSLPVPHYELCIFWNFMKYMNKDQLQQVVDYVECENVNVQNPYAIDDVCLLKFIRASCFKYMQEYGKSAELFREVMKSKPKFDAYLMPMAHAEYAHVMILTNRPAEAEYYFKKCLSFSGYSFTNYVQTRAYNYMNLL